MLVDLEGEDIAFWRDCRPRKRNSTRARAKGRAVGCGGVTLIADIVERELERRATGEIDGSGSRGQPAKLMGVERLWS